jgi:hypothetical protein
MTAKKHLQRMFDLQRMINETVKTGNAFHAAQAALNDFCREQYGVEPGDVDADEIIDSVMGGCGLSTGMKAKDFHRIMEELS